MSDGTEGLDDLTLRSLGALAAKMFKNPETRKQAQQLAVKVDPTRIIPELQIDGVREEFQAELKKRDDAAETATFQARMKAQKSKLTLPRDQGGLGLNAEQVTAVETMMQDRGIADYEVAGTYFVQANQLAAPTPQSFNEQSRMQLPGDKALLADPVAWARDAAHGAISDIMRGKAA